MLQSGSSSVIIQSQEIDRKLFAFLLAISLAYVYVIHICTVDETQVPPDCDETYVEGYTQDEGVLCCNNFCIADCMVLIAGEGNDVQDLSIPKVTVNSSTTIPTST